MNSLTIMPMVYPAARCGLFPVARDLQAAKMSHEVAMPTTKELRHIDEDDEIIKKRVSNPNEIAYINYATKYLYEFTMFIGYTKFRSHVWASVVKMPQGKVLYNAKDRVIIQVVVVVNATDVPSFNCMALYKLSDLNYIAAWDSGIPGDTLAERYAFIYDALVEEAKERYCSTGIKPF
ncbi:hypothetical protein K504DRAFT_501165 [Pleomassaria siparia CBS 279.74]|uniref:Uncharacterized protein n=1 Tax=Pleomassaria siparia CBS 279.74 TaxID=1314801 RepID=A0A6G1KAD4_9PLEO|nr:hypothetical protein K504DRAFT_501165 [Pleomassaria siparia CBS 279.74]